MVRAGGPGAGLRAVFYVVADVLQLLDRWVFYPAVAWLARDSRRVMMLAGVLTVAWWRTPLWLAALYVFAGVGLACAARYAPPILRRYARERRERQLYRPRVIRSPLGPDFDLVPYGRDPEDGMYMVAPRWWVKKQRREQRRRGGWGGR